jgi:lipopolysaccharide/colanic/teichoic acid biosynthesis glycosyltransferase
MTDLEFEEKLVRRFTVVQTPFGRWRLKWYIQWKRWTWRFMLASTLFLKRVFDFGVSLMVVIALSPMFLLLAALIKLEDGGPVFFKQTRVGKWGREFTMYKFRSMCMDAEERLEELLARNEHLEGVTFKMKDDPRITWTGKWMRLFSLDEFPQLWNVLRGDMSLVGPRPPVPREVELYSPSDRRRLEVTPGITCLWQIAGRSEIDFSGQVALDVQYIESQSFRTDLKILFKTIPAVLTGRGAC